jgi:hypothetical protein
MADITMPLGAAAQIAYAVDDVETAAASFAERFAAGPFFVRHHPPFDAIHRGQPGVFSHSSAYGQWGRIQVELVQFGDCAPRSLHDAVHATTGIHHVARFVESLAGEQARLEAIGMPCVMEAITPGGLRFAFHDARAALGHLIEIYEPSAGVLKLYALVADAAVGWDGGDPVRSI